MTGILDAVACLRALAAHRERWPACRCRRARQTPTTLEGHAEGCHEARMIQTWRDRAAAAEAEYRDLKDSTAGPQS